MITVLLAAAVCLAICAVIALGLYADRIAKSEPYEGDDYWFGG